MTFTSGEWKKEGLSVIVNRRGIICKCPAVTAGGVFDVEANVSLITAAPVMVKALEMVKSKVEIVWTEDEWEQIKQALAQAKGMNVEERKEE